MEVNVKDLLKDPSINKEIINIIIKTVNSNVKDRELRKQLIDILKTLQIDQTSNTKWYNKVLDILISVIPFILSKFSRKKKV